MPARNVERWIPAALDALAAQKVDATWEMIVADNGSVDSTVARARETEHRFPCLRIVDASAQVSANAARNVGVAAARGSEILFTDADDIVAPEWIQSMHDALQCSDVVGGIYDTTALNPGRAMKWRQPFRSDGLEVAANFLPYAFGGNLGVHRAVWEGIGGFDPAWARGGTEIEFTWRAQLAGYTIAFAKGSAVNYRLPTTDRELFQKIFISAKGHPRLYKKFRRAGMPRPKLKTAALDWAWLGYHLPDVWKGEDRRIEWARRLAWRAGLIAGSVQWHTLYL